MSLSWSVNTPYESGKFTPFNRTLQEFSKELQSSFPLKNLNNSEMKYSSFHIFQLRWGILEIMPLSSISILNQRPTNYLSTAPNYSAPIGLQFFKKNQLPMQVLFLLNNGRRK